MKQSKNEHVKAEPEPIAAPIPQIEEEVPEYPWEDLDIYGGVSERIFTPDGSTYSDKNGPRGTNGVDW